jgi:hypothetical protein
VVHAALPLILHHPAWVRFWKHTFPAEQTSSLSKRPSSGDKGRALSHQLRRSLIHGIQLPRARPRLLNSPKPSGTLFVHLIVLHPESGPSEQYSPQAAILPNIFRSNVMPKSYTRPCFGITSCEQRVSNVQAACRKRTGSL